MPAPWARGAEVRVVGQLHGQQCINVWHFATNTVVLDGQPLDDLLLALAQAMLECYVDTFLPAATNEFLLTQVEARSIAPALSDAVVATPAVAAVGQRGPSSVSFTASLLNLRTGGGGRRGRGKKFLAPPGEADVTASFIDQPTLDLLAAFILCVAGKFIGAGHTEDWELGIYSKTNDNEAAGTFDNSFRVVTQITANPVVARMGSRKIGKGA